MKKSILLLQLFLFLSPCNLLISQNVDSVYYYNKDGSKHWWYIQKDVYAFRAQNGQPYVSNNVDSLVVDNLYHKSRSERKINVMEFKVISTPSQKLTEKTKVRIHPIFECEFPVVTKKKTLDKTYNEWYTTDDYIFITFKDPVFPTSEVNAFKIRNDLILVHSPSNQLDNTVPWTYIFRLGASKCGNSDPITTAKEIWENEGDIVLISEPNIHLVKRAGCTSIGELSMYPEPNKLWHIENTGLEILPDTSGVYDADADICECWEAGYTGQGIKVGVIDFDGFQYSHEDMEDQFLTGWDCRQDPCFQIPNGYILDSYYSHGMGVTGIIAAKSNNIGTVGVAYNATIVPYLIEGGLPEVLRSLQRAEMDNVDIINMSLAYETYNNVIENEIINLTAVGRDDPIDPNIHYGCVMVAAAGNSFEIFPVSYPAAHSEVIGVGASNPEDFISNATDGWGFLNSTTYLGIGSNYGPYYEVMAPGTKIYTLDYMGIDGLTPGNYNTESATSYATPIVSGIAAILLSKNREMYWNEIRDVIISGADKVHPSVYDYNFYPNDLGRSKFMQYGRVNCFNSLQLTPVSVYEYNGVEINFINSNTNEITVDFSKVNNYQEFTIEIYNLLGDILYMKKVTSTKEVIGFSNLSQGLYIVNVNHKNGRYSTSSKIVKY